jgi:hypothetical protein
MAGKRQDHLVSARATLAAIALAFGLALAGCAGTPPAQPTSTERPTATEQQAADERPVTWDPEVLADFNKNVPRFVKALAAQKMEEMARERGTYLVDRALYDEAMAKYGTK